MSKNAGFVAGIETKQLYSDIADHQLVTPIDFVNKCTKNAKLAGLHLGEGVDIAKPFC